MSEFDLPCKGKCPFGRMCGTYAMTKEKVCLENLGEAINGTDTVNFVTPSKVSLTAGKMELGSVENGVATQL